MLTPDPIELTQQAFGDADASERLRAIVALREHLDVLEVASVRAAVEEGRSWSDVGDVLGVSKQSAHRRFAERIGEPLEPTATLGSAEPRIVVTAAARQAVRAARAAARAFGHPEVDTTHLLLGLLADADGPAARALESIGVDFDGLREVVTAGEPRRQERTEGEVPISPPAHSALEQSLREARRLNHAHLGPEHLLLGTVHDPEAGAVRALAVLEVTPDDIERCLGKVLLEAPFDAG